MKNNHPPPTEIVNIQIPRKDIQKIIEEYLNHFEIDKKQKYGTDEFLGSLIPLYVELVKNSLDETDPFVIDALVNAGNWYKTQQLNKQNKHP